MGLVSRQPNTCGVNDLPYSDCGCRTEVEEACPVDVNPNDCCKYKLMILSTPHLSNNGTVFFCTEHFTIKNNSAVMRKYMICITNVLLII